MRIANPVSLAVLAFLSCTISVANAQRIEFAPLKRETVEQRLHEAPRKDADREVWMKKMFVESGCALANVREQTVAGRDNNVICVLPGESEEQIVVGAHYDHVTAGAGVVDNWSGASLLPSLLEALKGTRRRHTYVFIAFAEEEQGLLGSKFYVSKLDPAEKNRIEGMINLDTLGLSPTKVWVTQADPKLVSALFAIANRLELPLREVDADKVGSADSMSFKYAGIPAITIHSVTQDTLRILHSPRDKFSAIHLDNYYDTYRLVSAYLAYVDQVLGPPVQKVTPAMGRSTSE